MLHITYKLDHTWSQEPTKTTLKTQGLSELKGLYMYTQDTEFGKRARTIASVQFFACRYTHMHASYIEGS